MMSHALLESNYLVKSILEFKGDAFEEVADIW
jgi:hypothetical protein